MGSVQSSELHHLSIRLRRDWYDAVCRTARREGQTIAALMRSLIVTHCRDEHRQAAAAAAPKAKPA